VFPTKVNDNYLAKLRALRPSEQTNGWSARITIPTWESLAPGAHHADAARQMVRTWQRMSKALVGAGCTQVRINIPMEDRYLHTPGLLGCPSGPGQVGDDHWSVDQSPRVMAVDGEPRLVLWLRRRAREGSPRRGALHAGDGGQVVAFAVASKGGFVCSVIGFHIRGGRREALRLVSGARCPNPNTAIAVALRWALTAYPKDIRLTVWTDHSLVRAAITGRYKVKKQTKSKVDQRSPAARVPRRRNDSSKYAGVRPPGLNQALRGLQHQVRHRHGSVRCKRARKGGATMLEIVSVSVGLLARAERDDLTRALREITAWSDGS